MNIFLEKQEEPIFYLSYKYKTYEIGESINHFNDHSGGYQTKKPLIQLIEYIKLHGISTNDLTVYVLGDYNIIINKASFIDIVRAINLNKI